MRETAERQLTDEFEGLRETSGEEKVLAEHMTDLWNRAVCGDATACDDWLLRVAELDIPDRLRVKAACITIRMMLARGECKDAVIVARFLAAIASGEMTASELAWIDCVLRGSCGAGEVLAAHR